MITGMITKKTLKYKLKHLYRYIGNVLENIYPSRLLTFFMEDPQSSKLSQLHIQPQYCSRAFVTNMLTSWAELGIRDQRASFCLGISLLRSLHVNGIHGKARGKVMLICQVSWYPRIHCATSWAEVAITVRLDSNYPIRTSIKSIQTGGYNSTHMETWFTVRLEPGGKVRMRFLISSPQSWAGSYWQSQFRILYTHHYNPLWI